MANLNGYDLSRDWFDFCFENPEKIAPIHTAMYFFIIEHCNRLGWKEKFGLPMEMTKDAIGVKNYKTYAKAFNDLVEWGFVNVIQKSKNQYSANIIALVKNTRANTKALTKARLKHSAKHSQKQVRGIVGIYKPYNPITNKPNNIEFCNIEDKKIELFKAHYKEQWNIVRERGKAEREKGFPDKEKKYKLEKANKFFTEVPKYILDNELNMVMCMTGQFKAENMIENQDLYDVDRVKGLLMRIEESEAVKNRSDPNLNLTVLNWIRMGVN